MMLTIPRIAMRLLFAASILVFWGSLSQAQPRPVQTPQDGLGLLQDQPDENFQAIELGKLHKDLQHTIRLKSLILFQRETLPFGFQSGLVQLVPPHRPMDAKIRCFAAANERQRDLLELSWKHRDVPLRLIASANISDLQFPLGHFREHRDADPSVDRVSEFVAEVLKLKGEIPGLERDYEVHLPWPEKLTDGVAFSSHADMSFTEVIWWFDRWDVVVKDDTVHILIYSRNPQIAGFDDGSKYFPAEFRRKLLERQER